MSASALGTLMRCRRADLRLSLRALARRLDMSPSHVSDLERGRRGPSEDALRVILVALGVARVEHDRWFAVAGIIPDDILAALLANPEAWPRVRETLRPSGLAIARAYDRVALERALDAVIFADREIRKAMLARPDDSEAAREAESDYLAARAALERALKDVT